MVTVDDRMGAPAVQDPANAETVAMFIEKALLRELATGIAHEVNQPLTAIAAYAAGAARLLRTAPDSSTSSLEIMDAIAREALRAGTYIQRARSLQELPPFQVAPVDLHAVLRSVGAALRRMPESRRLCIEVITEGNGVITGDAAWLEGLFTVLGRQYASGPLPVAEGRALTLAARPDASWVDVRLHYGTTRNCRADAVWSPVYHNDLHWTALSLALCETIVEKHGGEMRECGACGAARCYRLRLPSPEPGRA